MCAGVEYRFVGVEYRFAVASLAWGKMCTWGCGIEPTAGEEQKPGSAVDDLVLSLGCGFLLADLDCWSLLGA